MINLLPPEVKSSYSYAHRNVKLRHWVVVFMIALVGLGGIATYGLLKLHQSTVHYQHEIATTEAALKKEKFTETQKKVQDISSSFKLVVQVLGKEVLFSQLLKQIAAIIPAKANLTGLNISQTQGAIDISAITPDYNTATQVQINLADPGNKIFSKADIVSITCTSGENQNPGYPCSVTIKALFATDNPYLFVNSKGVKP